MNENPLYHATRAYVEAAMLLLTSRCEPGEAFEMVGFQEWVREHENWFALRNRFSPWWELCIPTHQEALAQLPERRKLVELLENDPDISPMIGKLVGTRLTSQLRELNQFTDHMIWLIAERNGDLSFDETLFDDLYPEWEADLRGVYVPVTRLAPLNGFAAPEPIQLGSNIVIDRMTDDEIVKCLQTGLIPAFPRGGRAYVSTSHCSRWQSTEPRIIGRQSGADGASALAEFSLIAETMRATLEALRLFKAGHLSLGRPATRAFVACANHWSGTGSVHSGRFRTPSRVIGRKLRTTSLTSLSRSGCLSS